MASGYGAAQSYWGFLPARGPSGVTDDYLFKTLVSIGIFRCPHYVVVSSEVYNNTKGTRGRDTQGTREGDRYPPVPPCHRRVPSCTTLPPEGTLLYHPATGGYTDSILARQDRSRESPAARTLNSMLTQSQSSPQQPGMVLGSGLQQGSFFKQPLAQLCPVVLCRINPPYKTPKARREFYRADARVRIPKCARTSVCNLFGERLRCASVLRRRAWWPQPHAASRPRRMGGCFDVTESIQLCLQDRGHGTAAGRGSVWRSGTFRKEEAPAFGSATQTAPCSD
ncbi:hypothetical protein VOLCADRAFT_98970 [Volvox carteri f. nagariensis]|uniref:Uncharacterized protein n=1 Tax=Volvox carteri f. nagariensis TaxID=3068 RepID=D8UGQ6_VOLCA|nr:uncharacterized protein VOLCADRAFT_98970 [Volvox carteri f. nagariensis]EFJ41073.1 hypothetical protein VOLCADRAFT_98970 [Volvox carteri f. nagariensis]|eukprot:XP_002957836.1 hypothetical protein VOLCADRAFT_98970 [Volvox carteri f. nagariensis]